MKCKIEECQNEANVAGAARGLCRAHYRRWQRYGDENEPLRRVCSWKGEICAIAGCSMPVKVNGLCVNHYAVTRRRSNPEAQKRRNLAYKERYRAHQERLMGRARPSNCEICRNPGYQSVGSKPSAGICFDHDHKTGFPRGWLCDRCNKVLGLVKDDTELLLKLALYLEKNKSNSAKNDQKAVEGGVES